MIPAVRKHFNESFTDTQYQSMLKQLNSLHPGALDFRLAETPIFIPKAFVKQMLEACDKIIDTVARPTFLQMTERSIPEDDHVMGSYSDPQMIAFDFGVCSAANGDLEPKLIEMQGFPSLYGFQDTYPNILRKHFAIPANFSHYLGGYDHNSYTAILREVILGKYSPENVILLEIKPHEQKTRIDFYCTRDLTGINPVCLTELIAEGNKLFYEKDGKRIRVNRIYNRIIFDDLKARTDLGTTVDIRKEYDVEWVPHPDWFYRISKYTLPFIDHPSVPETFFLNELKQRPDLENYVLKPLFSFAGQGVVIDVQQEDIDKIKDPENWILQRKVKYADVIETPDGPAKTEIRIMYLWREGAKRPEPVINLARLSKGQMIGTRYNKDKKWVGGTVAFFEL